MKDSASGARLRLISSMVIFGTIGLFVRSIPLPSSVIALARGVIGTLFLLVVIRVRKTPLSRAAIRKNLPLLCASGAAIGVNWILLFEAYRYTTVATATLCYYLAPVFVILLSPLVLKEPLNRRKLCCVAAALAGVVLVSGVVETGLPSLAEGRGILCGLGAAAFYAAVILMNQRIREISAYDKTVFQLAAAALVLAPYTLLTQQFSALTLSAGAAGLLLFVGIVHTGISYALYFSSMDRLPAQTIALFSYIDPVVAILLSTLLLREPLTPFAAVGAVLILGAAALSDLG